MSVMLLYVPMGRSGAMRVSNRRCIPMFVSVRVVRWGVFMFTGVSVVFGGMRKSIVLVVRYVDESTGTERTDRT